MKEERHRRCWGFTKTLHRCRRQGSWRLFCHSHKRQWIIFVIFLIFTVGGGSASLYSLLSKPVKPPLLKKVDENTGSSAIAGERTNKVDLTKINTWELIGELQLSALALTAAPYKGEIYVFGGYRQDPKGRYLALSRKYNPSTNTWDRLPDMPTRRGGAKSVIIGDKIYVIGGHNRISGDFNTLEVYDPLTRTWRSLASMHERRSFFCAVAVNNHIYVLGGDGDNDYRFLDSIEVYDTERDTWEILPVTMTNKRRRMTCQAVFNHIYVFGGETYQNEGYLHLDTVESLSLNTLEWEKLPSMNVFRIDASSVVLKDHIYVIGGAGRKNGLSEFNPSTNRWVELARMNVPRYKLTAVAIQNRIYVIGGRAPDGSMLSSIEVYYPKVWH